MRERIVYTATVAVVLACLGIVGSVAMVIDVSRARDRSARDTCMRTVLARDDVRAMWLTTFELFPDSPEVNELQLVLDERLPRLQCDGSSLNTIPSEEIP